MQSKSYKIPDMLYQHACVVEIAGQPWFVAADICRILGLNPGNGPRGALSRLAEDECQLVHASDLDRPSAGFPNQGAKCVSEMGLYKLIFRSNKPAAKPFQDWLTREVLPAIRKAGTFTTEPVETVPIMPGVASALQDLAAAKMVEALACAAEAKAYAAAAKEEADKIEAQAEADRQRKLAAEAASQVVRMGALGASIRP